MALVAPSAMGPTIVRSSLEAMLDSLRQRDEKPKDIMPALPIRPISKGRLPSSRRPPTPVKLNKECNGFEDQTKKEIASVEDVGQQTLHAILCVQKHVRGAKARRDFQELKNGVTPLQSFIRGWLARKHFSGLRNLVMSNTNSAKSIRGSNFKLQVPDSNKGQPQGATDAVVEELKNRVLKAEAALKVKEDENLSLKQTQGADPVVGELKNRVLKAEAALKAKEEENLSLKQQIQQYETRWSDYEAKIKTMEETWQKQMISLQMSLAEAKKSLVADDRTNQQGLYDKSPNNHFFDSEDTTSQEFQTPESTPAKQPRASAAILPVNSDGGTQTTVSHVVKEFEQKRKDFENDARRLVEVKSGQAIVTMNPDEELQKLKVRFASWKKDYKVKLRETKAELQKIGNLEAVKTRRRWWIIRFRR